MVLHMVSPQSPVNSAEREPHCSASRSRVRSAFRARIDMPVAFSIRLSVSALGSVTSNAAIVHPDGDVIDGWGGVFPDAMKNGAALIRGVTIPNVVQSSRAPLGVTREPGCDS